MSVIEFFVDINLCNLVFEINVRNYCYEILQNICSAAIVVTLLGIVAAKCKSTCSLILHIGLSVILMVVFGSICVICGMWLGGKTIINPLVGEDLTREDFFNFCDNTTIIEETNDSNYEGMIERIILI